MERYDLVILGGGAAGINALIPVIPALPGIKAAIPRTRSCSFPSSRDVSSSPGRAGVIGLEMAGAFSDFGAEVVIIGQEREILPAFDPDVAGYLRKIFEGRGVTFHLGATLGRLKNPNGGVQ